MISPNDAAAKLRQIDPNLSPAAEALAKRILDRQATLTPANHDDSPEARALTLFIEHRLAQPHLGYLAPDQVNGVWGGSTTGALRKLGARYDRALDPHHPVIGSDFLCAILDGTRANETPLPPANSYDWLERQVLLAGHAWSKGPMEMNAVGIRGYMVPAGIVPNVGNAWNDTIFLAWVDAKGVKHVTGWVASTDPGLYYYHTHPINPRGCAHLVPGQYRMQPGLHNGHPAFVQAEPVTVARTNAANYSDRSERQTGWFGVNNHAGFAWNETQGVDASSAGCQVTKGAGWQDPRWLSYRDTLRQDPRGWHHYTLIEGTKLAKTQPAR